MMEFEELKLLAMYQMWGHLAEEGQVQFDPHEQGLSEHPAYSRICKALEEAADVVGKQLNSEEWVKKGESEAWRTLFHEATLGSDRNRAATAARDFTDRAMPKVTRSAGETSRHVQIPESFLKAMGEALAQSRKLEAAVIDVTPED